MRSALRGTAVVLAVPALVAAVIMLPVVGGRGVGEPGAARAAPPGPSAESIPAYDVLLTIDRDAVLHVRETITYDFDGGGRGIVRNVPYRRGDRVYGIRDVRASSSTGAPARARAVRLLNDVRIAVGADGRKVTGRQAYVVEYKVSGAFTVRAGRAELAWDAVGRDWEVPIGEAAVRVEGPVPLRKASCRAGARGATTRCMRDRDGPYAIAFTQRALRPGEGMVVRVRLPAGAVDVPPPRYAPPRWSAGPWGTAALGLALGAAVLAAASPGPGPGRRRGRALMAAGGLVVLADLAEETVPAGPWAFSLGDPALAGIGMIAVGAGIRYAMGARRGEGAAIARVDD